MILRPQYTITPLKMEIWPIDQWSRELILKCLEENSIRSEQATTSMGAPAIKFQNHKDFERAYTLIKDITVETK